MSGDTPGSAVVLRDVRAVPGQTPAFVLVHLGCLLVLVTGVTWEGLAVFAVSYLVRGFGISAGYHRYFSHRSFRTSRAFQFVLALCGTMAVQKGVLWWASHHRRHHQVADTERDVHSPGRDGFWWAHLGWFLTIEHDATDTTRVRDLTRYPELVWLNRHFVVPPLLLAVGLYLAGGLTWLVWGFFVSTTAVWHVTYAINSVAHTWGSQPYATGDDSRNNLCLAVLALGEGWHNNHHHYMHAARAGFHWWQVDPTYYLLLALSRIGVVWDLAQLPRHAIERAPARSAA